MLRVRLSVRLAGGRHGRPVSATPPAPDSRYTPPDNIRDTNAAIGTPEQRRVRWWWRRRHSTGGCITTTRSPAPSASEPELPTGPTPPPAPSVICQSTSGAGDRTSLMSVAGGGVGQHDTAPSQALWPARRERGGDQPSPAAGSDRRSALRPAAVQSDRPRPRP